MNWTGGGLSRSRNAKNSLSAKQHQHFALKRASLHAHRSPPDVVFDLEHCHSATVPAPSQSRESKARQKQPQMQTILDDFEKTRPLVKKLQMLQDGHSINKRKRSPPESASPQANPRVQTGNEISPLIISSSTSSNPSSLPSQRAKGSTRQPRSGTSPDEPSKTSIGTKRRRLLQMRDWVGIERKASEPVHMEFADPQDRDMIGRRRKVNYKHPVAYQQQLKRITKLDRHNLLPGTTRLSSNAEDVSIRIGSAVDKSVKSYDERGLNNNEPARPPGFASPDQYFGVAGRTYRGIEGGAVDRSTQAPAERVSLCNPVTESHVSDEMLDQHRSETSQSSKPTVPPVKTSSLGRMSLADNGHRDVYKPSAFMDDSSPSPMYPTQSWNEAEVYQYRDATGKFRDYIEDHPSLDGSEWNLPDPNGQVFEEPRMRLVIPDTPRSCARLSQARGSSSMAQDFPVPALHTSVAVQETPSCSGGQRADSSSGRHEASDPSIESLVIVTPSLLMASSQLKTEFHRHGYGNGTHLRASKDLSHSLYLSRERYNHRALNTEIPPALSRDKGSPAVAPMKAVHQEPSQTAPEEEEEVWKNLVAPPDAIEAARPSRAPLRTINTSKETLPEPPPNTTALPPIPKEKEPPRDVEEEEKIWQNFIFSDQDEQNEWTIEEPKPRTKSLHEYNPSRTQPSMIAEVDTSPIKQNPHLLEEGPFESLNGSASSYHRLKQRHQASEFLRGIFTDASPSDISEQTTVELDPLQDFESILAEAPETLMDFDSFAQPPLCQSRTFPTSSLAGQASNVSIQGSSLPVNVSSDELHWSPTRAPPSLARPKGIKVIFTPPKRYIGERAEEPPKHIHIGGRVLRNGKRVSGTGEKQSGREKRKRRVGKQQKHVEHEVDGDEIVDD